MQSQKLRLWILFVYYCAGKKTTEVTSIFSFFLTSFSFLLLLSLTFSIFICIWPCVINFNNFLFPKMKTSLWNHHLEQMTRLAPDAKMRNGLLYMPRGTLSPERIWFSEHCHKLGSPNDLEQIRTSKHNYTFF